MSNLPSPACRYCGDEVDEDEDTCAACQADLDAEAEEQESADWHQWAATVRDGLGI